MGKTCVIKDLFSDVHPNNIYVTRGGTLKLGHFSQSRVLVNNSCRRCITPTGTEEFMCYEKVSISLNSFLFLNYSTVAIQR